MATTYSLIANVLMVIVLTIMFRRIIRGTTDPNPITWFIWVVVMTMNVFSYHVIVKGNWTEMVLAIVTTLGVISIFGYSLWKGKFQRVEVADGIALVLAVIVGVVWKTTENVVLSNAALQVVLLISFLPTIRGIYQEEIKDHPLPWTIAVVSYGFQILTVLSSSAGWHWAELCYPIVNGILGNGSVAVVAFLQRKSLSSSRSL